MTRSLRPVAASLVLLACQAKQERIQSEPPATAPLTSVGTEAPDGAPAPASEDAFEAIFQTEQADSSWAALREVEIKSALAQSGAPQLMSATCKATICKIEVKGTENPPMRVVKLALKRSAFAFYLKDQSTILYAARPGYELPNAPNAAKPSAVMVNGKLFVGEDRPE